jgi:hypothetical protein
MEPDAMPTTDTTLDASQSARVRGAKAPRWVKRWDDEIDPRPVAPGVYRRKAGGFRIRGRVVDPRTGRMREVRRALPDAKRAIDAAAVLAAEIDRLRSGTAGDAAPMPRIADYAATIFERKVAEGRILSAATREKWRVILRAHILPAFGDLFVDKLAASDVEAWKARFGARIRAREASPTTGNTILAVLRVITAAAADEYDLKDPMRRVRPFDTRGHRSYTPEAPNSLAPADVSRFLDAMRERFPQYYAITFLGFVTGLRPSSLRPLRRAGASPDLDLATGLLLVRRSHTRGGEVMEATKTGRDQRIPLPPMLLAALREHIDTLTRRAAASDLLFPSTTGSFLPDKPLRRAIGEVAAAIGVPYKLTTRGMRRTFQDLMREAGVADVITRAISGHATESMQRHYSTARDHEIEASLAAVVTLAAGGVASPQPPN